MIIPGIFSQRDARWSADTLGNNPGAPWILYNYGCLLSSVSNLIWYVTGDGGHNPRWTNEWLRNAGGFTPGGGNVIWDVLNANLNGFNIQARGYTGSLDETNAFLAPEQNYALAWITKPGFPQHWALMPYVGMIADPWDGKLKPVGTYIFHGAHLYTHVLPQVVTPPAPTVVEPIPEGPVIESPAVAVPSTEAPVENPNPQTETPPRPDPALPEYQTSWTHWDADRDMTIVRDGAYAFDAEKNAIVAYVDNGDSRTYAGSFTCNGIPMFRTRFAANNGTWMGVPSSFFEVDSNYTNAPLPVTVTTNEQQGFSKVLVDDVKQTATIWRSLLEAFYKYLAHKLNKGTK